MSDKPNVYPLGTSNEFIAVDVSGTGTVLEFAITPIGVRPTTYTPAVIRNGQTGTLFTATEWGQQRIFARFDNGPLIDCGIFLVA